MNNTMLELKQQLKHIADLISDKNDVLYFDYPMHLNVGDLLIYAGTEQFFSDYQINVRLRRCLQDFSLQEAKKYITPNTTLICHGGGNFGDLYPMIQKLREDIVKSFPNNRIIVMPQTAYFSNEAAMKQSSAIFKSHKDCHLFARDIATYHLMRENFSQNTMLSPDMAHQLYGKLATKVGRSHSQSAENVLYFLRKDIEKSHLEQQIRATLSADSAIKDWDDILTEKDHQFELWMSRFASLANKFGFHFIKNFINKMWYKRSLEIIERVRKIFISYDLIVTSRLHGHIFSCLLEVPNKVCDNAYGKNLGYYEQWTKQIEFTQPYQA